MTTAKIIYFCPTLGCDKTSDEILSISKIIETLKNDADIDVDISPSWANLMIGLQESVDNHMLVVFRLDFLERKNIVLDEVLSMLSTLTKFVADKRRVDIAVVVPKPCSPELLTQLKRNGVLGIIPGMRFFDKQHSIEAYKTLRQGIPHWPKIAITNPKETKQLNDTLTDRQYEIFNLVARRGLSNRKIAETLHITEDTVKAHVGVILKKYGVRNRTQLALANKTGELCE